MPPTSKPGWKVKLDIVTQATTGYTRSGTLNYWYKYTGGNTSADNGDIEINASNRSSGGITFEVSLQGHSNGAYNIKSGDLKNSSTDITIPHPGGNKLTITDTEQTNNETVNYGVTVNPKNATTPDIVCDPSIKHTW